MNRFKYIHMTLLFLFGRYLVVPTTTRDLQKQGQQNWEPLEANRQINRLFKNPTSLFATSIYKQTLFTEKILE